MKTNKLTGSVLFGNILRPRSYNSSANKFTDDPRGAYQLTLIVDEGHKDYVVFKDAIENKMREIKALPEYRKLIDAGVDVQFSLKDKPHTDKDGNLIVGKRQVTMKRNAINKKGENVEIDIFNKLNEQYRPATDVGYGTKVQASFAIGDTYIGSSKTWYLTFYLLAVMIEEESVSSYGFDVHEPELEVPSGALFEGAKPFAGETPPPYDDSSVPF